MYLLLRFIGYLTNKMHEELGNISTKAFSQLGGRKGRDYDDSDIQEISTKKHT